MSEERIHGVTRFMNQEYFPIPQGFTDADVNLDAPRLFSDGFYLYYLDGMRMIAFTAASSTATLSDVRQHYNGCLSECVDRHNACLDVLLAKGLFTRPPCVSIPDNAGFVDNRSYLTGFFGRRRTVNAAEITNLYVNIQRNVLGKALVMGFAQVAQSKSVRKYMERGKDISHKHVKIFSELMQQDDLPVPMIHDHDVTDSRTNVQRQTDD